MSEEILTENGKMTFDDKKFSLDIQKGFIRTLIFDFEWAKLEGFEALQEDYFESIVLKNIYKVIKKYFKRFKAIPTEEIVTNEINKILEKRNTKMSDFWKYQTAIQEIYTLTNSTTTEWYKDQLIVFVKQCEWRKLLAKGESILEVGNYDEAIRQFSKVLCMSSDNDMGIDLSKLTADQMLEMIKESENPEHMIKTGLPSWDEALGGGFAGSNLHLVCAPPGSGKSRCMVHLATEALKQNKNVIFITLELSEIDLAKLFSACATGITEKDLMKDPSLEEPYKAKYSAFHSVYDNNIFIKYYPQSKINVDAIHNFISRTIQIKSQELGREWKPDVIFIDYLDKILPIQRTKGNSYEDIGAVASDCKNLAVDFKCPVISASQLGKTSWDLVGNQVVSMQSIAESAQKVHLAHSMTTINFNGGEKAQNKCRLYLAKSRTGNTGALIYCNRNLATCRLEETEKWDPKELDAANTELSIKTAVPQK